MKSRNVVLIYTLFPLFVIGDTYIHSVCSGILTDFKACFSGELKLKQLINGWKWGDVSFAFTFDFEQTGFEPQRACTIFAASPLSENKNRVFSSTEYPKVGDLWNHGKKPYLFFGVKENQQKESSVLVFVYCSKKSDIYPYFLNILNLNEPSYEEAQVKYPDQCWDTTIYDKQSFQHFQNTNSRIDDLFIHWDVLTSELDVVYRYNQQKCMGVMLIRRDAVSPISGNPENHRLEGTLDLSKLTNDFKWIPKHQLERFAEEMSARLAQDKSHGFIYSFSSAMLSHIDNNEFVRHQGFRYLGAVRYMSDEIPDVPWAKFSYYKSANNVITLRSRDADRRGDFNIECFDSFVLNVEGMTEEAQVLLPNGLDIKPYLHSYPSENVLYEHIRFDKRYRIIVQPYIAYLYRDKSLIKILVCGNKNGPADHGWSLVRGYYCYEGMDWYYWPVSKAYSPLEN